MCGWVKPPVQQTVDYLAFSLVLDAHVVYKILINANPVL